MYLNVMNLYCTIEYEFKEINKLIKPPVELFILVLGLENKVCISIHT